MEIDWQQRVKDLKRMAAELEQWTLRSQGRQRLVLGRIADDLKRFAEDIDALLEDEYAPAPGPPREIPDWLVDAGEWGDEWEEEMDEWHEDTTDQDDPWMDDYDLD